MRHLILLLLLCATAQAQWPQGKGQAYIKLGSWAQQSRTHFEPDGSVSIEGGLRTYFIPGLYARVGLNDKWTATGYFNAVSTSQSLESVRGTFTQSLTSFGDMNLSLERLLYRSEKGFHLGTDITFGLPTGNANSIVGSGDGEFNQMVRVLAGTGYSIGDEVVGKQNFYAKGYVGINRRTEGFSSEFRGGLETGTTIKNKLFVLTRLSVLKSLNNKPLQDLTSNSSLAVFGDRIERTTLGFEATWNLDENWGISAGYTRFLAGKIVFNQPSWTTGIVYKLNKK